MTLDKSFLVNIFRERKAISDGMGVGGRAKQQPMHWGKPPGMKRNTQQMEILNKRGLEDIAALKREEELNKI